MQAGPLRPAINAEACLKDRSGRVGHHGPLCSGQYVLASAGTLHPGKNPRRWTPMWRCVLEQRCFARPVCTARTSRRGTGTSTCGCPRRLAHLGCASNSSHGVLHGKWPYSGDGDRCFALLPDHTKTQLQSSGTAAAWLTRACTSCIQVSIMIGGFAIAETQLSVGVR